MPHCPQPVVVAAATSFRFSSGELLPFISLKPYSRSRGRTHLVSFGAPSGAARAFAAPSGVVRHGFRVFYLQTICQQSRGSGLTQTVESANRSRNMETRVWLDGALDDTHRHQAGTRNLDVTGQLGLSDQSQLRTMVTSTCRVASLPLLCLLSISSHRFDQE